ncbi:hypothetical protein N7466_010254 [Penicillium verhagenii]|uniref:uncharacterized protein n=1 Tax=Penicillium verhagenii TaxID=1562060 RepID=UPI002544EC96|nr:uncharacterized protein N7466_010254 [Penicillium verhagenii]KAJ5919311.1 hypothetical protein N7466_010254 [Penicillium verhagenii]
MKPELKQQKSYTRYPYDKDLKLPISWENADDRAALEVDRTDSSQVRDLISTFYQRPAIRKQFRKVYTSEGLLTLKYFSVMDSVELYPDLKKSLRRNNSVFETYREHPHMFTSLGMERKRQLCTRPPPTKRSWVEFTESDMNETKSKKTTSKTKVPDSHSRTIQQLERILDERDADLVAKEPGNEDEESESEESGNGEE